MPETPSRHTAENDAAPDCPLPASPCTRGLAVPAELVALSAQAIEDWVVKRGHAGGSVAGGPTKQFTNGSGQSQIACFTVPTLPDNDPRDPVALQAANAAFAVACVQYVRELIGGQPESMNTALSPDPPSR